MSRATEVAGSATVWVGAPGANEPWTPLELEGAAFELIADASAGVRFRRVHDERALVGRTAVSLLARADDREAWCLLASGAGSGVRVNGELLLAGARVLRNRDEIALGGARFYFTMERIARAERFAAVGRSVPCARCGVSLEDGEIAVRCPRGSCGRWHHHVVETAAQTVEDAVEARKQSCWETADVCAGCLQQPTSLDVDLRWVPEE